MMLGTEGEVVDGTVGLPVGCSDICGEGSNVGVLDGRCAVDDE